MVRSANMHDDIEQVLLDEAAVSRRVNQLGKEISAQYAGKNVILICILKGAVHFFSDLSRQITCPMEMDFMSISSYGNNFKTSGIVRIAKDIDVSITGRHVLIVEDIMDSGRTLSYLINILKERKPASFKVVTLLDKPDRRVIDVKVDYTGFQIPDEFVVGYGLDYDQRYRNLPYIGVVKFD